MQRYPRIIYPSLQQPVPLTIAEDPNIEAKWHYAWHDPVRVNHISGALIASGCVFPLPTDPETVTESRWHQPWSEPVRLPVGLRAWHQQFTAQDLAGTILPAQLPTWFRQWTDPSVPVSYKLGLGSALQQFYANDAELIPAPSEYLQGWLMAFGEPVRSKAGLAAQLQQTLAYHPRILPNPNVTATMSATETNSDVFSAAVNVYDASDVTTPGTGAKVSIVEVAGSGGDPVSIQET